jgi:hypothetical protein
MYTYIGKKEGRKDGEGWGKKEGTVTSTDIAMACKKGTFSTIIHLPEGGKDKE